VPGTRLGRSAALYWSASANFFLRTFEGVGTILEGAPSSNWSVGFGKSKQAKMFQVRLKLVTSFGFSPKDQAEAENSTLLQVIILF
jgi:hypothetical protein